MPAALPKPAALGRRDRDPVVPTNARAASAHHQRPDAELESQRRAIGHFR
jgi:hypothetical protein